MTQEIWALVRSDGTIAWQGHIGPDDPEIEPDHDEVLIALDRFVEPWERVDRVTGQVSIDHEARRAAIDAAYLADHGPDTIARARAIKLMEAVLITATGEAIDGVLSAEASLRGLAITEMAQMVIAAAQRDREVEIERMRAKAATRSGDDAPQS